MEISSTYIFLSSAIQLITCFIYIAYNLRNNYINNMFILVMILIIAAFPFAGSFWFMCLIMHDDLFKPTYKIKLPKKLKTEFINIFLEEYLKVNSHNEFIYFNKFSNELSNFLKEKIDKIYNKYYVRQVIYNVKNLGEFKITYFSNGEFKVTFVMV